MHRHRGSPHALEGAPAWATPPATDGNGMTWTPLRRASDFDSIPVGRTAQPDVGARVKSAVWSMDAVGLEKDKGFHFACRELVGDGVLVARVASVGSATARAGLLMRSGPQPSADTKAVWLQLSDAGELRALWRHGLGASRVETHDRAAEPPWWLKLVRRGNGIHGWGSPDGREWDLIAHVRFHDLPSAMLVGLAACAGSDTDVATATFDHVRLASAPQRPVASHPWLTLASGVEAIHLAWRRSPGTAYHNVLRATAPGGPYTRIAHGVQGLAYEDTAVMEGVTYHYVVEAVGHGRPNLRSNESPGRRITA